MLAYHNIRMRVNDFRNVNDQPELKHNDVIFEPRTMQIQNNFKAYFEQHIFSYIL